MTQGWLAAGIVVTLAAGSMLYRGYKTRTSQVLAPSTTQHVDPVGQSRGTMPRVHPIDTTNTTHKGQRMRSPLTINDANAATQPPRVSRWFLALPPVILLGLITLVFLLSGDFRIAATLGIVQGLGEPLPISSSAHLIITPWLFGWDTIPNAFFNTQTYDVALHVGTLLALVGFFWRDWIQLLRHAPQPRTPDGRLFWLIVIASLPGAAIGFVLDRVAADFFRDRVLIIAAALAVMGIILYIADKRGPQTDDLNDITWFKALQVGLAQALAFVPGVSRSGSTMTMSRILGLKRETAARFSFLMAMPITFGAAVLKLKDVELAALRLPAFWMGIGMSFVVGVLAIGFLLRYLKSNSFLPFVIYRLGLAALIVIVYFSRG